jgi:hypothetical protein
VHIYGRFAEGAASALKGTFKPASVTGLGCSAFPIRMPGSHRRSNGPTATTEDCWDLREGECVASLASLQEASIDVVITDPPYEAEAQTRERLLARSGGKLVPDIQIGHEGFPHPSLMPHEELKNRGLPLGSPRFYCSGGVI